MRTAFGDATARATDVAIDGGGRIVAAGLTGGGRDSSDPPTEPAIAIARFEPDGDLDPSFSGDGRARIELGAAATAAGLAITPDDRVVVGGSAEGDLFALRLLADGAPDASFGGDGIATADLGADADRRRRRPAAGRRPVSGGNDLRRCVRVPIRDRELRCRRLARPGVRRRRAVATPIAQRLLGAPLAGALPGWRLLAAGFDRSGRQRLRHRGRALRARWRARPDLQRGQGDHLRVHRRRRRRRPRPGPADRRHRRCAAPSTGCWTTPRSIEASPATASAVSGRRRWRSTPAERSMAPATSAASPGSATSRLTSWSGASVADGAEQQFGPAEYDFARLNTATATTPPTRSRSTAMGGSWSAASRARSSSSLACLPGPDRTTPTPTGSPTPRIAA